MAKLTIHETKLQDVKLIEPTAFGDHRGFFMETYSVNDYKEAGLEFDFVQDNHSLSVEPGVLRGLHFQTGNSAQTKLISVITGVVLDVIVDVRVGSPTYGQWEGYILSEYNHRQLLVPKGYAHGFVTLTPNVNFIYKCDNYYNAESDSGIAFNDSTLSIKWPISLDKAIISDKDNNLQSLKDYENNNPFIYEKI